MPHSPNLVNLSSHSIVYFKTQLIVSPADAGSPIADLASSYAAASAP